MGHYWVSSTPTAEKINQKGGSFKGIVNTFHELYAK